jgi:aminoglycoside/choline kinase family phosphotransferase
MHKRQTELNQWLVQILGNTPHTLTPLAGDASFRRYFRLKYDNVTRVVMDAPPEKESIHAFIYVAHQLKAIGVHAPELFAVDETLGFIILEDLGDNLLLGAITKDNADDLYTQAMLTLLTMQPCSATLPMFDKAFMRQELAVFEHWFLQEALKLELTMEEKDLIETSFDWLTSQIALQPQTFIHRDYHSRNLLVIDKDAMGVIDFQDAMRGPFTYDLVSLLKDCYVQWPREQVLSWLTYFYTHLPNTNSWTLPEFTQAFDLCGLQRHLKVLGVFCRLHLRDNKTGYLRDLPLTFQYVTDCLENTPELQVFYQFMQDRVAPLFFAKYLP